MEVNPERSAKRQTARGRNTSNAENSSTRVIYNYQNKIFVDFFPANIIEWTVDRAVQVHVIHLWQQIKVAAYSHLFKRMTWK